MLSVSEKKRITFYMNDKKNKISFYSFILMSTSEFESCKINVLPQSIMTRLHFQLIFQPLNCVWFHGKTIFYINMIFLIYQKYGKLHHTKEQYKKDSIQISKYHKVSSVPHFKTFHIRILNI